ncbi:DEAD/DEAH box helicase family protein [Brachyspira sp.]|uniref:DEAD/DEAH box helicase family protein n=1 Tax=Brachyspira sp. TaxID=1977261 RepID=UPI0026019E85|nr:DEAD/DEAH box helicase family protein [Brachyspira sp.]
MEYESIDGIVPVQGAFYTTTSRNHVSLNCFSEEKYDSKENISAYIKNYKYKSLDNELEDRILTDFNCQVIKNAPEFITNKYINTPTNRILTSMCSKERLLYILQYGIVYVKSEREIDGKLEVIDEKHIIRYQQLFATMAVTNSLLQNINSGIIWHTQGSGKTALSYYLHKILTNYYSERNTVAKFYFIVDRIDLLEQASREFTIRGLKVIKIKNRQDLLQHFQENSSMVGNTGQNEIIVINIQKFTADDNKVVENTYATNIQRIFIIDEAHRGYNPTGSFLGNLLNTDKKAVKLALTGTPLLTEERESWRVFGKYIHTYYYDKSIKDGYTLKIIREDIATEYKDSLINLCDKFDILIQKKELKKHEIIEHDNFITALYDYIRNDFNNFRVLHNDISIGGMIICETNNQAKKLFECFKKQENEKSVANSDYRTLEVGLILHDYEDKDTRKIIIDDFKKYFKVDILIVNNMLLTGFDAPRLKRLYFGRKLELHNLLQAITRVNRPYKTFRYGYVVDFADIKQNFDETNRLYLEELSKFDNIEGINEDDREIIGTFEQVIENKETILSKINEVKELLFNYTTNNIEQFCSEISRIDDKTELLKLKRMLVEVKEYYNIVRSFGDDELKAAFNKIDIKNISTMINEIQGRIDNLNLQSMFSEETHLAINEAMQYITFDFKKMSEEELNIIDGGIDLQEKWAKIINEFTNNQDHQDPEYISIKEAFIERFKENHFRIATVNEYHNLSNYMNDVLKKLKEITNKNSTLVNKYDGDYKYLRIHKRIKEQNIQYKQNNKNPIISNDDSIIFDTLKKIKAGVDENISKRNAILTNEGFISKDIMQNVAKNVKDIKNCSHDDRIFIRDKILNEYMMQYKELINS